MRCLRKDLASWVSRLGLSTRSAPALCFLLSQLGETQSKCWRMGPPGGGSNCRYSAGAGRAEGGGGPALPGAHLRPHHCPLCHWQVGRAWAASAHSAGTVPGGSRVGGSGLAEALEWTGTGRRKAHLHQVLTAVGRSATLAVVHHHLCQQFHIIVHLLYGTHPLRDLLHPLLVLEKHRQMAPREARSGLAPSQALPTPLWTVSAGWA